MPVFTCNQELPDSRPYQGRFLTTKHMHKATPPQSSPFLSVNTSPYIENVSRLSAKISTTTDPNAVARSISPCFSTVSDAKTFYSAIDVADIYMPEGVSSTVTEIECATPDSVVSMGKDWEITPEPKNIGDHKSTAIMPDGLVSRRPSKPRYSKEQPSFSSSSSASKCKHRSASQSTENRSASSSRRSSRNAPRRVRTDQSQTSTTSPYRSSYSAMSRQKHQDLLSLHQNSCRLFQSPEHVRESSESARIRPKRTESSRQTTNQRQGDGERGHRSSTSSHARSYSTPVRPMTNSNMTTSQLAHSSLLNSYGIYLPSNMEPASDMEREAPPNPAGSIYESSTVKRSSSSSSYQHHHEEDTSAYKPIPPTVIDWTSPSTRKREYEKIDRSYRGIRGLWRRLAPRCCQRDRRTPFFEEGKCGKGVHGGSVRRFRMDFPDDGEDEVHEEKINVKAEYGREGTNPSHNGAAVAAPCDDTRSHHDGREREKRSRFKIKR